MSTDTLQTFVTLAELGSYTKTAQQMMVVPSTVSKQIAQIEKELGCALVIRDKKAVKLTHAGEIYLNYAKTVLGAQAMLLDDIRSVRPHDNVLQVGAVVSLVSGHMMSWLNRYLKNSSSGPVSISTNHSQILLNNLYDGMLDLCFTYRSFYENNCVCLPFVRDEIILATGGENPVWPDGIRLEELRKLPVIRDFQLLVADRGLYEYLFGNDGRPFLSVGSGSYVVPLLKAGNGYGFVIKAHVREELDNGTLTEIPILGQKPIRLQSYVIYKKANPMITETILESIQAYADAPA